MRHAIFTSVFAVLFTLPAIVAAAQEKPPAHKPAAPKAPPADKLKALGEHLGRALDLALDILSGNEAEFLSGNKAALLSGNSARTKAFNGEKPTVLSGNKMSAFSGNKIDLFSNIKLFSDIKVEIHVHNSGTNSGNFSAKKGDEEKPTGIATPILPQTTVVPATPGAPRRPPPSKEAEPWPPPSGAFQPPALPK